MILTPQEWAYATELPVETVVQVWGSPAGAAVLLHAANWFTEEDVELLRELASALEGHRKEPALRSLLNRVEMLLPPNLAAGAA